MALSTAQLRVQYSPACRQKSGMFLAAYAALDAVLRKHNYRPRANVTGAYNCRRITNGSGYSLHAYGPGSRYRFWTGVTVDTAVAVDINWDRNPYGPRLVTDMPRAMIDDIYRIRTRNGQQVWAWGGYYSGSKDAMHFEIVCSKASLATGIAGTSIPSEEDIVATLDQLKLVIKESEDRQNAWTRAEIDRQVKSIKQHNVTLRDGLASLIRALATKLGHSI